MLLSEHVSGACEQRKTDKSGSKTAVSGAVSGQNPPLKIRSTIKTTDIKSAKSIVKVTTVYCQCEFITILFCRK